MDRAFDAFIRARVLENAFQMPPGRWSQNPAYGLPAAKKEFPHIHPAWISPKGPNLVEAIRKGVMRGNSWLHQQGKVSPEALLTNEDMEDLFSKVLADIADDVKLGRILSSSATRIREQGSGKLLIVRHLFRYAKHRAYDIIRKRDRYHTNMEGVALQAGMNDTDRLFRAMDENGTLALALKAWENAKKQNKARSRHAQLIALSLSNPRMNNRALGEMYGISGSAVGGIKKHFVEFVQKNPQLLYAAMDKAEITQGVPRGSWLQSDRIW